MLTILFTAILSSIFTAVAMMFVFQRFIQPYLDAQITYIKQQTELTIEKSAPQVSQQIADAMEDKFNELRPDVEKEIKQELEDLINDVLPVLAEEVEKGVDNSFKKFIPTIVGSATTLPAETIIKTSSTILNTGLGILRSATDVKK